MDLQEEFTQIMKGKRTKRPRQSSPLALTMASTSSSSMAEGSTTVNSGAGNGAGGVVFDRPFTATASTTDSGELTDHTVERDQEEEEDMANCLILLAQGHRHKQTLKSPENRSSPATNYYQCKTCDRSFPSFQALGGHRASHNKPNKAIITIGEAEKKPLIQEEADQENSIVASTTLSLQIIPNSSRASRPGGGNASSTKSRVHECSICGAEFSSGQALGGHMRRHRSAAMATTTTTSNCDDDTREVKKSKNVLALDLNLPAAPEDENGHRESNFVFANSKKQVIVFSSASPLVDCHY